MTDSRAPRPSGRAGGERSPEPARGRASLDALRIARSLGLALLLVGQMQYVSAESRVVLGRWSLPAAAALAFVASLLGASVLDGALRLIRARGGRASTAARSFARDAGPWLDLAVLLWGFAYLLAALDDPSAGGRLLELDLLGSLHPPSIALEWLAMAAATVGLALLGWRALRPRAPGLYLLLLTTAFLAVASEGITRAVVVVAPATQGFPTASTRLWLKRFGTPNALGFRDREHAEAKAPGVYRILVVGDSFTYGMGIDRPDERVGERLERELPARIGRPVEVVNAGLPFTHTLQHIATLERLAPLKPDLVLLLYCFNDIGYLQDTDRPSAALGDGRSLVGRLHPMRLLFQNSFLVQQVYARARHVYWSLAAAEENPSIVYDDADLVARHVADLGRFVAAARAQGAEVAIVPFNPAFALEDGSQRSRLGFLDRVREVGLPLWDVEQAFAGEDYGALVVNAMDHHPNALANRRLADVLLAPIAALAAAPSTAGGPVPSDPEANGS